MATAKLDLDDIQGIVAQGYGKLRAARFLLLAITESNAARSWIGSLVDTITTAASEQRDTSMNVALTAHGLDRLSLPLDVVAMFGAEFAAGMVEEHRNRLLGDVGESAPDGWRWGGPRTPAIDAVLMLYGKGEAELTRLQAAQTEVLAAAGIRILDALDTVDVGSGEHFGFNDGISQPAIEGIGKPGRAMDTVRAGEFLLGYENGYGQYTNRPLLPRSADPTGILHRDAAGSGRADLGRNGSYLVFRQLRQDVRGFWQFMDATTRHPDGSSDAAARIRLAAKIVGRWPSGAPLVKAPDRDDPTLSSFNDFAYYTADSDGFRCPIGAHIRRSNPRDSLEPTPGSQQSIDLNKLHRSLRRGRDYGPAIPPEALWTEPPDPEAEPERGLYFICLNANIGRQFEFIQGTWVNSPKFNGLYNDADPLVGQHGTHTDAFTIPTRPIRRRVAGLPQFVRVRGGAYFFLPGIRALRYLGGPAR
jgi:Dyp-type peroxidase family